MKKFIRKLFNRTMGVVLLLLIEFAVLVAAIYFGTEFGNEGSYFYEHYPNLRWIAIVDDLLIIILLIMQIIMFFVVLYKQMDAEFKIPWILILLLIPVIGSLIYLIFGKKNLKKKDARLLAASDGLGAKYFQNDPDPKVLGDYHKTFDYINNNSVLCPHEHNRVTYFKNGESFFPVMIEDLKKAKEFIFIEFFIIGDGNEYGQVREILHQKAKEGVDVRVIFDDLGSVGVLPGNEVKNLRKAGVKAYKYNRFKPIVSGIYNNRDHRKICVIDHKYGYTGGMNLADEYANIDSPFGYWKDTMIKIEGSAINNLIQLFLTNFDLCSRKTSNHGQFLDYKYEEFKDKGVVYPFGHGPSPYFKERVGEETLINIINSAQKSLYISSPYFIPSESLLYSIRRAALNGVDTYLFLPGIPDKKLVYHVAETYFRTLLVAGVKIMTYRPGFNHMKTILADEKLAFVGTINCDYRSLVHHFECGAVLYDTPCCEDIKKDFDEMIVESEAVPQTFQMGRFMVFICALIRPFVALL